MTYVLEIDERGNIHLPESVQNARWLQPGGRIRLEDDPEDERSMRLTPEYEGAKVTEQDGMLLVDAAVQSIKLISEKGFPVIEGLPPEPIEDTVESIRRMRRERMAHVAGPPYRADDFL